MSAMIRKFTGQTLLVKYYRGHTVGRKPCCEIVIVINMISPITAAA